MNKELECCTICPHNCKINRTKNPGRCKSTDKIKIALYSIHNFEEPCISGEKGSGTIFFSNCNMNCVFCQNYEISQLGRGKEITIEELANVMIKQQERNVQNINLVTPTSYALQLITAVKNSNRQKHIPLNSSISLNSAAYEDNDDMDKLEIVDLKAEDDPSDIIANQEYSKTIERKIKENLSEYELSVLYEYEKGHSYADIAEKLKTKVKSVDTAIQRIKKKANKIKESIDS